MPLLWSHRVHLWIHTARETDASRIGQSATSSVVVRSAAAVEGARRASSRRICLSSREKKSTSPPMTDIVTAMLTRLRRSITLFYTKMAAEVT